MYIVQIYNNADNPSIETTTNSKSCRGNVETFPGIPPVDGCIDCLHEVCGRMTFQDRQPLTNHM